jgi:hypothetical protein
MLSGLAEHPAVELADLLRNYCAEVTAGDRKSIDAATAMMQPGSAARGSGRTCQPCLTSQVRDDMRCGCIHPGAEEFGNPGGRANRRAPLEVLR